MKTEEKEEYIIETWQLSHDIHNHLIEYAETYKTKKMQETKKQLQKTLKILEKTMREIGE